MVKARALCASERLVPGVNKTTQGAIVTPPSIALNSISYELSSPEADLQVFT